MFYSLPFRAFNCWRCVLDEDDEDVLLLDDDRLRQRNSYTVDIERNDCMNVSFSFSSACALANTCLHVSVIIS